MVETKQLNAKGKSMPSNEEIALIESEYYDSYEEAEMNADDLANDGIEAIVGKSGDKFCIVVVNY